MHKVRIEGEREGYRTSKKVAGGSRQEPRESDGSADDDATGTGSAPPSSPEQLLTRRELEVLVMVVGGASNAQIADRLVISESTVKSHVKNILRKLGARNRTQAASMYLRG
jgi:DNA-binding NarL/FixJ family response regulator